MCNIYDHIKTYPHLFEALFCEEKSTITSDSLENIFEIVYSELGSSKRMLENRAISYFRDYLADCESELKKSRSAVLTLTQPFFVEESDKQNIDNDWGNNEIINLNDILIFATGANCIPVFRFSTKAGNRVFAFA